MAQNMVIGLLSSHMACIIMSDFLLPIKNKKGHHQLYWKKHFLSDAPV